MLTPYEKMPERVDRWGLSPEAWRRLEKIPWVVTEKLHGAHLCVVVDATQVRLAKRKALLRVGEDFFGVLRLWPALRAAAREVWAQAHASTPGLEALALHGELFGGRYPHPEVAGVEGVEPVQTGVWYAPDIAFCVFDAALTVNGRRRYAAYDTMLAWCGRADLMCAEPLRVDRFERAMTYPTTFTTTLPTRLGLPPLADNLAEGVVIKPLRGDEVETPRGFLRPVLKRKHPRFNEDARYHQARPPRPHAASQAPSEVAWLEYCASAMVTEQRLDNAISKRGRPRRGHRRAATALFAELVSDVFESLEGAAPGWQRRLESADAASLERVVRARAHALFNAYFLRA